MNSLKNHKKSIIPLKKSNKFILKNSINTIKSSIFLVVKYMSIKFEL